MSFQCEKEPRGVVEWLPLSCVGKNEVDLAGSEGVTGSSKEGYIISCNLKYTNTKRLLFKRLVKAWKRKIIEQWHGCRRENAQNSHDNYQALKKPTQKPTVEADQPAWRRAMARTANK
ncbi:hypothetical protein E2C01_003241 [Portunus trituberculatus]|uniref:Uncharacterized protein n=1 Tax=Portunus trituberculatus TaxID=210409 RepID=A0A5B7CPP6_PORTR|nr:hypothetical protein [Portunus trituberculatus]